mmetsp:Transcript_98901/g.304815  ORF Transcript_98901/g.304815 Transcript_98901/m.304815 type:complete len:208 (+) Transcript_98901:154-777(+)
MPAARKWRLTCREYATLSSSNMSPSVGRRPPARRRMWSVCQESRCQLLGAGGAVPTRPLYVPTAIQSSVLGSRNSIMAYARRCQEGPKAKCHSRRGAPGSATLSATSRQPALNASRCSRRERSMWKMLPLWSMKTRPRVRAPKLSTSRGTTSHTRPTLTSAIDATPARSRKCRAMQAWTGSTSTVITRAAAGPPPWRHICAASLDAV